MTAAVFAEFEARELSTSRGTLHAMIGGSGPPLLLLHGYPQTDLMWHAAAPPLAEPDPRAEPGRRIGLGT